ncbi:SMC-Scp complex subunit ScpB [Candidatus Woesearchaeota archaeon]|nr:SMC-Scp complex subunit ScpB [Candidatus Woesearchaeota archaeon]
MDIKHAVEALLFASAKRLTVHEIAVLCRKKDEEIEKVLKELQEDIKGPIKLIEDEGTWRLSVKEQFIPVVRKIVTKTELPKSILETLAVVAYKAPVLQSKVVKIRTNKAYDHLSYLEKHGFITREKSGRTKLIRLSQKFYDYFDIDSSKLKGRFKNAAQIEKAIDAKEKEVAGELETYDTIEPITDDKISTAVEPYTEKVGELDVVDMPEQEDYAKEIAEAVREAKELETETKGPEFKGKGLFPKGVPKEIEKKVDKRVKELLGQNKNQ